MVIEMIQFHNGVKSPLRGDVKPSSRSLRFERYWRGNLDFNMALISRKELGAPPDLYVGCRFEWYSGRC